MSAPGTPAGERGARGAAVGRRIAIGVVHGGWRPRALGTWRVPSAGPVILAGNHAHNVDGPMIMGTSPRPVRFLVKREAFVGPVAGYLRAIGQISVDRQGTDRAAVAEALAVLDAGQVLGIFPEGSRGEGDFAALRAGLAYFALRSGAPIVPVAVLGSNEARGRLVPAFPPLRRRIDVVYGDPFTPVAPGGRRTRAALDDATLRIQERLAAHLKEARRLTGR
ncbi:lysophospholipid acyltransferase family protein [Streptomyces millisiae]|uniref:Lysophospholipid acyltransferase family protein n=1 Tax=Streptomyces millisiae TaxID=3075542 RepID=A0ABU2LXG0_9ACTN|nr:lysophospholipid acyltransferase family protein [Streptomyces sp. DSM 44918]MDT0321963.1 lysophospholipid acyltransferase family protein [Streptomyces sp. DSM 44918]